MPPTKMVRMGAACKKRCEHAERWLFFQSEKVHSYHFAIVVLVEVFVVMILGRTRQARQIERVPHRLHEHALRS